MSNGFAPMSYKGAPLMSKDQTWETPPELVEYIANLFEVNFTLDACASPHNAKAFSFITEDQDALKSQWFSYGGATWLNPPFGHGGKLQRQFIQKAILEVKEGRSKQVFALIPARTDTKLFHDDIMPHAQAIYFLKGRVKFKRGSDTETCAPFPSMLVIFENVKPAPLQSLLTKIFSLNIPVEYRRHGGLE